METVDETEKKPYPQEEIEPSATSENESCNDQSSFHKDTKNKRQSQYLTLGYNWEGFISHTISIKDEYTDPPPLINCCNELFLSRGNIAMISGKPKAFKTFLVSAMVASIESEQLNMEADEAVKRILIVDTEQSKAHAHKVLKRIYKMCGWSLDKDDDRVAMIALREYSIHERLQAVLTAVSTYFPDVVIIDGVRDLIADFNSIEDSSELVGMLMQLSTNYDCGIVCILHQNKGDNNARGHLGSELANKSETVMQVVNDKGIATVSPVHCRNREFDEFSFRINHEGLPELCEAPKVSAKTDKLRALLEKAMFGSSWILRPDLVTKLVALTGKVKRTCERYVSTALSENLLRVNERGYLVLDAEDEKISKLPF
ncbi:MAG: AAA family ATPase [Rikenellaceae bacterium]